MVIMWPDTTISDDRRAPAQEIGHNRCHSCGHGALVNKQRNSESRVRIRED